MNMKSLTLLFLIVALTLGCSQPEREPDRKPNVLLIITDDQGYGDVGYYGNDTIETPTLNSLSENSVVFDRFYVSPVCAPTRASLLTGRYHLATGTKWVTHRMEVMNQDEETLAEILKAEGYQTGLFGKWHNGKQYPHNPTGQGFDEFLGFTEGHFNNYFDATLTQGLSSVKSKGYLPDVLTDSAIKHMDSREAPFFTMVAYNTPHSPFQVPDAYFDKYKSKGLNDKNACVYGMVENIDDNISKMLKHLDSSGQAENTVVIFMTDNGPNGNRYNAGLKGWKGWVDEGGVRVPFMMRYPKLGWNDGRRISKMAAHVDILPTIMELIGSEQVPAKKLDGRSLRNLINGENDTDRYFMTHQTKWIRSEGIGIVSALPGAIRSDSFLLTFKDSGMEFYNLIKDPFQKLNLVENNLSKVQEMETAYNSWFENLKIEQPELPETGHEGIPEIEFGAQEAHSKSGVKFKGGYGWANDYFVEIENGAEMIWKTKTVKASSYKVSLLTSTNVKTEVTLETSTQIKKAKTMTDLSKSMVPSPDRVERGEVYEYQWSELLLGQITLEAGENTLKLNVPKSENTEIKALILKSQ